jgi:hypothetical protein
LLCGVNVVSFSFCEADDVEPARPLKPKEPDMRMPIMVLGLMVSIACAAAQTSARAEEYRGTLQQQLACTPDVFRLCGEHIPDANRILACLQKNTPQLSDSCRAVFDSNDSVPEQVPSPRRNGQPKGIQ